MRKYLILLVLLGLTGCSSAVSEHIESVTKNYDMIVYKDGIDEHEAKVIAQRELIKRNLLKIYDYDNPLVMNNTSGLPNNEKYWFIYFKERKQINILYIFVTLIDKKTGNVRFSDDMQEGKDWILEAALLGG